MKLPIQYLKSESGQSVILVATVLMSFMLFFGFAINTGLLVTAKISLQSAADAAAYAGAATQARQLNAISYLNYDMRRQFKKFAFRYAVVGSLGNPQFPEPQNPNQPNYYNFGKFSYPGGNVAGKIIVPVNVPSVCIPIVTGSQPNDNCLVFNLPNTAAGLGTAGGRGLTRLGNLLYDQINAIQQIQQGLCAGNSSINFFVLTNWLFKAEPGNQNLRVLFQQVANNAQLRPDELTQVINNTSFLVQGLGLFPRNILSLLRIETLTRFLNEPPAQVDQGRVQGWTQSPEADQHERTIQAFESAVANLNETVMNPATLEMTELQAPRQLETQPVTANFFTYVHYLQNDTAPANDSNICKASVIPFPVTGAPVGIKRAAGSPMVHYAVKLKAKAKLLFLPNSDGLELEAVAAAKPFGSRIGPAQLSEVDFIEDIRPGNTPNTQTPINDCSGPLGCKVPNVRLAGNATMYDRAFLRTMKQFIGGTTGQQATPQSFLLAQTAATAPNPVEIGRYNIIPPPKPAASSTGEDMRFEFIPYATNEQSQIYRFYAPLFLQGQSDTAQRVRQFIDRVFGADTIGGTGQGNTQNPFGVNQDQLKATINEQLVQYINGALTNGRDSEYNESLTFAALELPMFQLPDPPAGAGYWIKDANSVLTSWAPTAARIRGGANGLGFKPRFGYSVKFVTLQNLLQNGMPASDDMLENVTH